MGGAVRPTSLDMSTRGRDILAQSAITPLMPGVEPQDPFDEYVARFGWEDAVVHGFAVRDDESYEDLTATWSDCLVRRQEVDRSLTRP